MSQNKVKSKYNPNIVVIHLFVTNEITTFTRRLPPAALTGHDVLIWRDIFNKELYDSCLAHQLFRNNLFLLKRAKTILKCL